MRSGRQGGRAANAANAATRPPLFMGTQVAMNLAEVVAVGGAALAVASAHKLGASEPLIDRSELASINEPPGRPPSGSRRAPPAGRAAARNQRLTGGSAGGQTNVHGPTCSAKLG